MPFDREIHLGYVGADAVWNFADRIGANILNNQRKTPKLVSKDQFLKTNSGIGFAQAIHDKYSPALRQAYINTILAMGWKIVTPLDITPPSGGHLSYYLDVVSPWGRRETRIWSLDIHFDPDECGDGPDDVTVGVNLSSRYIPTMLDMHDVHGGMGSVIKLNQVLMNQIAICKRELVALIPELHDADVYIKEIFH